jgi:hypothetical protein
MGPAHRPLHRRLAEAAPRGIPPRRGAFSTGSSPHLDEAGIGAISEIFDPEPRFTPRVAEFLRASVRTD